MEDFDYFGSDLPAQNGDAESTPDWEDFSETLEEAAAREKRCAIKREQFKKWLSLSSAKFGS